MKTGSGPATLGERIKDTYRVLFENSHAPQSEPEDELKKLFHIHSGGGPDSMRLQIQTFKALSEHASFGAMGVKDSKLSGVTGATGPTPEGNLDSQRFPPVQVDLHIHLPET